MPLFALNCLPSTNEVDLPYLLDRPGVLENEVNWEDELSLGEKQRLAIARLVFHKPRFAILDECTSAVSSRMEINLYDICERNNITYITISHRPALMAFHDRMLAIGDGKQGWKMTDIDRKQHLAHFKKALAEQAVAVAGGGGGGGDSEGGIERAMALRSEPFAYMADEEKKKKLDTSRSSLSRLGQVMRVALPTGRVFTFGRMFGLVAALTYARVQEVTFQGTSSPSSSSSSSVSSSLFALN